MLAELLPVRVCEAVLNPEELGWADSEGKNEVVLAAEAVRVVEEEGNRVSEEEAVPLAVAVAV